MNQDLTFEIVAPQCGSASVATPPFSTSFVENFLGEE